MVAKKTELKRREEYLALLKLSKRMAQLAISLAEKLAKKKELAELDLDAPKISLMLRMPCLTCEHLGTCDPLSNIASIFLCNPYDIGALNHLLALKQAPKRIKDSVAEYIRSGGLPFKVSPGDLEFVKREILMLRFPGRLKILYNALYPERSWGSSSILKNSSRTPRSGSGS